jgi:hypothetical protein
MGLNYKVGKQKLEVARYQDAELGIAGVSIFGLYQVLECLDRGDSWVWYSWIWGA